MFGVSIIIQTQKAEELFLLCGMIFLTLDVTTKTNMNKEYKKELNWITDILYCLFIYFIFIIGISMGSIRLR